MRLTTIPILLASAAVIAFAMPALAESYIFRAKLLVDPPQAFVITAVSGATPGADVESATTRVKGYGGKSVTISGGAYQICAATDCSDQGSAWRTADTVNAPAEFYARVRATAPTFGQTVVARLTVGNASAAFAVTSRAKDETPAPISFTRLADQASGASVDSEIRQLVDHDGTAVSVSGTGSSYRVCADATCSANPSFTASAGTAAANSFVQVRQVAPAAGQTQVATLAYGPLSASWSVTSAAPVAIAGIEARCNSWAGTRCNDAELNVDGKG